MFPVFELCAVDDSNVFHLDDGYIGNLCEVYVSISSRRESLITLRCTEEHYLNILYNSFVFLHSSCSDSIRTPPTI